MELWWVLYVSMKGCSINDFAMGNCARKTIKRCNSQISSQEQMPKWVIYLYASA